MTATGLEPQRVMARTPMAPPEITTGIEPFVTGPLATLRTAVEQSGLSLLPLVEPVPGRK